MIGSNTLFKTHFAGMNKPVVGTAAVKGMPRAAATKGGKVKNFFTKFVGGAKKVYDGVTGFVSKHGDKVKHVVNTADKVFEQISPDAHRKMHQKIDPTVRKVAETVRDVHGVADSIRHKKEGVVETVQHGMQVQKRLLNRFGKKPP